MKKYITQLIIQFIITIFGMFGMSLYVHGVVDDINWMISLGILLSSFYMNAVVVLFFILKKELEK